MHRIQIGHWVANSVLLQDMAVWLGVAKYSFAIPKAAFSPQQSRSHNPGSPKLTALLSNFSSLCNYSIACSRKGLLIRVDSVLFCYVRLLTRTSLFLSQGVFPIFSFRMSPTFAKSCVSRRTEDGWKAEHEKRRGDNTQGVSSCALSSAGRALAWCHSFLFRIQSTFVRVHHWLPPSFRVCGEPSPRHKSVPIRKRTGTERSERDVK
jgi:hypothetical protein